MRRVLAALFVFALTFGLAAPVSAAPHGEEPEEGVMVLDPTEGPPGSTFTVTNDPEFACNPPEPLVRVSAEDTDEGSQDITPDENGDWTATFTVSADTAPGTIITVEAACGTTGEIGVDDRGFQGFRGTGPVFTPLGIYAPEDFTVTAGPTTTEGSTTTEGTTTTTEPPASLPDSETAPDVVQTPTLTG